MMLNSVHDNHESDHYSSKITKNICFFAPIKSVVDDDNCLKRMKLKLQQQKHINNGTILLQKRTKSIINSSNNILKSNQNNNVQEIKELSETTTIAPPTTVEEEEPNDDDWHNRPGAFFVPGIDNISTDNIDEDYGIFRSINSRINTSILPFDDNDGGNAACAAVELSSSSSCSSIIEASCQQQQQQRQHLSSVVKERTLPVCHAVVVDEDDDVTNNRTKVKQLETIINQRNAALIAQSKQMKEMQNELQKLRKNRIAKKEVVSSSTSPSPSKLNVSSKKLSSKICFRNNKNNKKLKEERKIHHHYSAATGSITRAEAEVYQILLDSDSGCIIS